MYIVIFITRVYKKKSTPLHAAIYSIKRNLHPFTLRSTHTRKYNLHVVHPHRHLSRQPLIADKKHRALAYTYSLLGDLPHSADPIGWS